MARQPFNPIEEGQEWPDSTPIAKAIWPFKPKSDLADPLSFRIPTVTSALFRLWAGARVREFQDWTKTLAFDELFSGCHTKALSMQRTRQQPKPKLLATWAKT